MSRQAEREWDDAIKGANFMTPRRVEVGYTADGYIYELSAGGDFSSPTREMYGVSILIDGNIDTDRSQLFNEGTETERWDAAAAFVHQLAGTVA